MNKLILLILAVIFISGCSEIGDEFDDIPTIESDKIGPLASYFSDQIISKGVEKIGQPIEGFDAYLLKQAFPGLRDEDFHKSTRDGFDERVPPYMANDHTKIIICLSGGCSRLYFAQKHNLNIPCIIADFADKFKDLEQLYTEEDICSKYKDPPEQFILNERGVFLRYPNHIHLQK